MPRPKVTITAPNQLPKFRAHLDQHLPQFAALPGVIGITLNGGLSRGYADDLSEIDVTFFLTPETYQHWQAGHAPFGTGIQVIDGALYDLKPLNLDAERARDWDMVTRWDASYAEILHDPSGAIAALLADKLVARPDPNEAGGPLFAAWWHFELAGNIWIKRGDPLQGHMMLNQAITELLKALYLLNREYVPHEKWLIHMSYTLDWTPPNWKQRLTAALCDLTPTIDGLRDRQTLIAALWANLDRHLITTCGADIPAELNFAHAYFYRLLAWLAEYSPVSTAEWQTRASLDMLNSAPFHQCVSVIDDRITLHHDRLLALTPDDMYRWHYMLVAAWRAALHNQ